MMMKELTYNASRVLSPYPGEPEKVLDGRLTLTFYMRPAAGHSGDLIERYNGAAVALDRFCSPLFANQLLIGRTQPAPPHAKRFLRLHSEADCGELGDDLLRRMCPPVVASFGFNLERLNVAFGVYEKAQCYPRRDAVKDYAYNLPSPPDQGF